MNTTHIDEFYYTTAEVLCSLYAAFPTRHLVLVEDIAGPIQWDMTGLPDRKSRACFETLIWLAEHGLLSFRTVEPREIGIEGAVLTQQAFVLLTGMITWEGGGSASRIQGLVEARRNRAYSDLGHIVNDIFRANCHWSGPVTPGTFPKSEPLAAIDED